MLIIVPKTLVFQWQDEMQTLLDMPSAVWTGRGWQDETGYFYPAENAKSILHCPRRVGIISQGLVARRTEASENLKQQKYECVILDEALDDCRDITLRYDEQFTIQLASSSGEIHNRSRFVYLLEGFNKNWVKTSEQNPNITYNSLSPGSYTLRVRMLNDDGSIGDEEARMDITILPAIWRTRWAILLYMLIIAGIALLWRRHHHPYAAMAFGLDDPVLYADDCRCCMVVAPLVPETSCPARPCRASAA